MRSPSYRIVAFGDSITDGARSTADANTRWPDQLARRLAAQKGAGVAAVAKHAIAADSAFSTAGVSALARSIATC
jgi:lysophospholipase L1-like esterase